jgi:class 3 adenylate cyclase
MNKTVLELDLVGYSSSAAILEENTGSGAVAELNEQIQSLIDQGLSAVGAQRERTVMATTGDGAILLFDKAEHAHRFATTVHEATRVHNSGKTEPSAKRLFRMGAATGDVTIRPRPDGGADMAGVTIARAVRLEAAARPGEMLVDALTFDSLPPALRDLYGGEEKIRGKRTEQFAARRCVMNPEVPEQENAHALKPARRSKGVPPGLYHALRQVLIEECEEFADHARLLALFRIESLSMWRKYLPPPGNLAETVDRVIGELAQRSNKRGENALASMLLVLAERHDLDDGLHERLSALSRQCQQVLSDD